MLTTSLAPSIPTAKQLTDDSSKSKTDQLECAKKITPLLEIYLKTLPPDTVALVIQAEKEIYARRSVRKTFFNLKFEPGLWRFQPNLNLVIRMEFKHLMFYDQERRTALDLNEKISSKILLFLQQKERPEDFDSFDFVHYVYKQTKEEDPLFSQWAHAPFRGEEALKPGNVVVLYNKKNIPYCAIYLGPSLFLSLIKWGPPVVSSLQSLITYHKADSIRLLIP